MPYNGAGQFERTPGTRIANQGLLVSAQINDETDNLVNGINAKLSLSGQLPMTGPLAMGGFKITGLLAGVAATDAANVSQITQPAASETVSGIVELATTAEAAALTDTTRSVTAAGLAAAMSGKKAIWIDAGALIALNVPCGFSTYDSGSEDITVSTADFDTTAQEYALFKMAMPVIWNEGTVTFKPYWTNTGGASAETVVWSLRAAAFSNDDALNTAYGTAQTSTDTWLAQNDLHIGPESAAITISNTPAAGDLVVFQITRVTGSDTMAGDARLIGIMLYVTTNAFNEP